MPTPRAGSTPLEKRSSSGPTSPAARANAPSSLRNGARRFADLGPEPGIRFAIGMPARSPASQPASSSRRRYQLEGSLLERGVLERALHLVGPRRVAPAAIEVLGDRVERHPLAARAVAGGVAGHPAAAEDAEPYRLRHSPIASSTRSHVRRRSIAPGWQRLQYAQASPLPLPGWL